MTEEPTDAPDDTEDVKDKDDAVPPSMNEDERAVSLALASNRLTQEEEGRLTTLRIPSNQLQPYNTPLLGAVLRGNGDDMPPTVVAKYRWTDHDLTKKDMLDVFDACCVRHQLAAEENRRLDEMHGINTANARAAEVRREKEHETKMDLEKNRLAPEQKRLADEEKERQTRINAEKLRLSAEQEDRRARTAAEDKRRTAEEKERQTRAEAEEQERQTRVSAELHNVRIQQEDERARLCAKRGREEEMTEAEHKTRLLEIRLQQRRLEEELGEASPASKPADSPGEFSSSAPATGPAGQIDMEAYREAYRELRMDEVKDREAELVARGWLEGPQVEPWRGPSRVCLDTVNSLRALPPDELVVNAPLRAVKALGASPLDINHHKLPLRVGSEAANRDRTIHRVKGEPMKIYGRNMGGLIATAHHIMSLFGLHPHDI